MNLAIVEFIKGVQFRYRLRRRLVFTPEALRQVSKRDAYAALDRHHLDHLGVFEDRKGVEFYLATDPESLVTTVMLPEEYRS